LEIGDADVDVKQLSDIQPGKKVFVVSRYDKVVHIIARCTDTQIILDDGRKFRKGGLTLISRNKWDRAFLEVWSAEEEEEMRRRNEHEKQGYALWKRLNSISRGQILALSPDQHAMLLTTLETIGLSERS
jgi:hypothetical protein